MAFWLLFPEQFYLVYWVEEGGVSTIHRDDISSLTIDVNIGSLYKVKFGKGVFPGKIAACGKYSPSVSIKCVLFHTACLTTICIGNKKEISELEDKFIYGDWTPPFSDSSQKPLIESTNVQIAPPAKRRRKGGNEKKVGTAGKENASKKKQPAKPKGSGMFPNYLHWKA